MSSKTSVFIWEGVDSEGSKKTGEIVALNQALIKAELRNKGIKVKKIKKKKEGIKFLKGGKIKSSELSDFTRQFATLIKSGINIVRALDIIIETTENEKFKAVISGVRSKVNEGLPLYMSFQEYPEQFDYMYCGLIQAGEDSGALETMLDRLATHMEKSEMIKKKIKKALSYPISVVVIAMVVVAILLIKVVPVFQDMFDSFGAELPAFTQIVINMSEFTQSYWYFILGIIVTSVFSIKKLVKNSEKTRNKIDMITLKLPIFGSLIKSAAVARFSRILATTFAAGVPLIDGLDSVSKSIGNKVYSDAIDRIKIDVASGVPFNETIREQGVFPPTLYHMVAVGEESGALDAMLNKTADIFENDVNDAVDALTSMMEPMIMAILGIVLGGLIIAMYLPVFQMGNAV